jgi:hypothetical protein
MGLDLAILAALIALYAVVATKLGRWSISGPMATKAIGFLQKKGQKAPYFSGGMNGPKPCRCRIMQAE